MALPVMTPEQRAEALAKAAEARKIRTDIKGALKAGGLTLAEVLGRASAPVPGDDTIYPVLARTKVSALLQALPGIGPAKAAKVMSEIGIAGNRRAGALTPRQREALEAELARA